jgi:protein TonB
VLAKVDKTGAVTEVEVISGPERFRDAATDAVKQWRYSPYLVEGVPVEVQTIVSLDFLPPR